MISCDTENTLKVKIYIGVSVGVDKKSLSVWLSWTSPLETIPEMAVFVIPRLANIIFLNLNLNSHYFIVLSVRSLIMKFDI